ncbi:MAG: hypothetical protein SFY96_04435 [Planctomycetota bacterium]|nr:hypothetical protein [Planctomycetota bacterium]
MNRTRWGRLAQSATLVIAALLVAVFANILAARHLPRLDVTATGEHQLSPRTRSLLSTLTGEHRIVIATDFSRVDPRARRDAGDVIDEFRRASDRITVSRIDTGSSSGMTDYAALLSELSGRDREELERQGAVLRASINAASDLASYLDATLSPILSKMRDNITPATPSADNVRAYLDQRAAACRLAARDLQKIVQSAAGRLDESIAGVTIPDTTAAAGELTIGLTAAVDAMNVLVADSRKLAEADTLPANVRDLAKPLVTDLPDRRDAASVIVDQLSRLPKIAVLRVAGALKNASGVLVIGPREAGLTVIPADDFFVSAAALDVSGAAKADIRRRCEDLLSGALAGLARPNKPIVVFVHAEPRTFILSSGAFNAALDRLARQGIDILEWAALAQPDEPSRAALDPKGVRPVVYIVFSPDSSTSARSQSDLPGPQRATKLGQVLTRLADEHKSVLLCLNPSVLPTFGDSDPMANLLPRFGLRAQTGQPILSSLPGAPRANAATPLAQTDATFVCESVYETLPPAAIAPAVAGLRVTLPWAVALSLAPHVEGVDVGGVVAMPAGDSWRETQWLRLWQTPRAQRALLAEQPVYDAGQDLKDGPWLVAAASQLTHDAVRQRLVVVGSSNWLVDQVTQQAAMVDGRAVPLAPANLELLDASVTWLAGEDELIAPGPGARSIALVSPLRDRQLIALRLFVVVVIPLGVLALGVAWRILRG